MDLNHYLSVAIEAVRKASIITAEIQQILLDDDTIIKKDKSPVTIADFAAQAVVCKQLNKAFPQIPIVGEEDSGFLQKETNRFILQKINEFLPKWQPKEILEAIDLGNDKAGDLFWTLDPVDGTKGFIRKEQYAVGLALIYYGKPVVGVLGCPNLLHNSVKGCLAYASNANGAFIQSLNNGKVERLSVSTRSSSDIIRFLESVETGHSNRDLQEQIMSSLTTEPQIIRYDSMVKYCIISRSEADVYLRLPNPNSPGYVENIWDHAAGVVIVEEAGGKISDMNGKTLDFGQGKKLFANRGVIVTNAELHSDVIRAVQNVSKK